jgi:hypothetical protein
MRLVPLLQTPTAWSGVHERFAVHVFEGHVTLRQMADFEAVGDEWLGKNPGKLVELVIIHPSDSRMTHEERSRMAQVIKRWERQRVAAATVILATGMLGAMQRSVLTGLLMLAPPPHPTKVFGVAADAIDWLAPHVRSLSRHTTPAAMHAAVADFNAAFAARSKT